MKKQDVSEQVEKKRKPSVKEIADITGFSPSTVSLALNNKGTLSEHTRKLIMQTYDELEIFSEQSFTERKLIRLLIEESSTKSMTDPYNTEFILGVEEECRLMGFEVILTFVRPDSNPLDWIQGINGIILLGGGLITDSLIQELHGSQIPIMLVDNYIHDGSYPSIHPDHYEAGFIATQYLIKKGHTKIGFINGPSRYKPLVDRYAGYCAALAQNGIPIISEYISNVYDTQPVKGFHEMLELMRVENRPTAVFAVSDKSAIGAVEALKSLGLKQGKDIELIGCDNIPLIKELDPPIPTIHIPRIEIGKMAIRFLYEAIKGNKFIGKIVIPGKLILPGYEKY